MLSIIYDIIWMIFNFRRWWRNAPYDGDLELTFRRFTIIVTFISLFFRLFVLLVFWKASVDYNTIIGAYKKRFGGGIDPNQSVMTERDLRMDHKEGYYRKTFA